MDKKEIIRRAFEKGILLSPEALNNIDGKNLEEVIEEAKSSGRPVLSSGAKESPQVTVKIRRPKAKKSLSVEDVAAFYQSKYNTIKDMLDKKLKPVSINKAADIYADVSVIGMVKDRSSRGFMLEDQTGEIEVVSNEKPELDDVVGIRGSVREGKLFLQEIVWPDVPLTNSSGRIAGLSVMLTEKPVDSGADVIFTLEPNGERTVHVNANPAWITVSKASKKATILVYRPPASVTVKDAADWLKKRCLPHKRSQLAGPENPFLLKKVPDMLWAVCDEAGQEFYKGVTIISPGKGKARVDLGNMKAEFL